MGVNKYRVRFRFLVQKMLNVPEKERRLTVAGREVVLSPLKAEVSIADSQWLVMNAREIDSENEAIVFARKLKISTELSSVITRLGIDAGIDTPTSRFAKIIKDNFRVAHGVSLRDNVHGIDIFPDDPNVRIGTISATLTVRAAPDPFLSQISDLYEVVQDASQRSRNIILLLNYALTRSDPVATIVFAISAVEMLGQSERWSAAQVLLLNQVANAAESAPTPSDKEREEVASAIRRSVHKLSLRQGVMRLLSSLGISNLRSKWDALYEERSQLVHGLAPTPGVDYSDLAMRTMSLCGFILLKAIAKEIPEAEKELGTYYSPD